VFESAPDALAAALSAQRSLHREAWGELGAIRVRMGSIPERPRPAMAITSRRLRSPCTAVAAAGHGGQTLLSAAAAERVRDGLTKGTTLRELACTSFAGLPSRDHFELVAADLPSTFHPCVQSPMAGATASPLEQLVRGRLVGRGNEARALRQHWDNAQQARGRLVLLSGEPGVGKTRLAQDLVDHAHRNGRHDPARRLLRIRSDHAVHAVRRGFP
jgi:hypothetical protein